LGAGPLACGGRGRALSGRGHSVKQTTCLPLNIRRECPGHGGLCGGGRRGPWNEGRYIKPYLNHQCRAQPVACRTSKALREVAGIVRRPVQSALIAGLRLGAAVYRCAEDRVAALVAGRVRVSNRDSLIQYGPRLWKGGPWLMGADRPAWPCNKSP
jgi:hypothetical protein